MNFEWILALIGGVIIGIAVSIMLLWKGRVTGISGIVNGTLSPVRGDTQWRILFLLGLFLGGIVLKFNQPAVFASGSSLDATKTITAGLLVGFGTIMGSGCTSGHGICGISRLSPRSIVATLVFILSGIFSVYFFRRLGI